MSLVDRFKAAGLELEVADAPLRDVRNPDVFQLDVVVRGRRKGSNGREVFRIWPGHPGNRLEVPGLDAGERQLVLLIHEPRREIIHRKPIPRHLSGQPRERLYDLYPGNDLIAVNGSTAVFREWTRDKKRHYLCGRDERQLFIAELNRGVSTVRDAHAALAPETLPDAAGNKVARQGEWFFVEATADELELINDNLFLLDTKEPVGYGGGRPHVVDEALTVPATGGRFVRGAVRHPDHRTIRLRTWHSVHLNQELRGDTPSPWSPQSGSFWID